MTKSSVEGQEVGDLSYKDILQQSGYIPTINPDHSINTRSKSKEIARLSASFINNLPSEMLLLEISQTSIRDERKCKCEFEPDITTELSTAEFSYWPSKPHLSHTKNSTHDAETEGNNGCNSRRKLASVHVDRGVIAREAALEEDVLWDGDAFIDGEPLSNELVDILVESEDSNLPVSDQQHEVLENRLKVPVARNGNSAVNESSDESPDEARNSLRDLGEELEGERDRVDVGAVVCNNGESEDNEAELTELSQRWYNDCREKTADSRCVVAVNVDVFTVVGSHGCSDCSTQHLREEKRKDESQPRPDEDRLAGAVNWLVNGVVCSI